MIYINDDLDAFSIQKTEECIENLPLQRREKALKFRHELGRKQCVLAYLLLCNGLKSEYGITEMPDFEYGEHGKPSIIGHPDIHFNLSHCKTAVACAISDTPIGIDIESIRDAKESVIRYAMNDAETQRIMESSNPALEFTKLWTIKESVLKLTGEGINDNMKSVLSPDNLRGITIETIVRDEYVYSVARGK
ncbi:MAG: 4'-phosphopantetheinyl transferase superfamily protein [Bacteroidaceae bacterium]|nr:4'-phosphopantetheinyl transferase superfamily protein [Bacteroidaceae bacterium]